MAKDNNEGFDWIELAARAGKLFGLSPVRTRWRLRAWRDRARASRGSVGDKAALITRKNKVCPRCGSVNSLDDKVCAKCRTRLRSRPMEMFSRFLGHFSVGLSPETFLAAAFVIVYAITLIQGERSKWLFMDPMELIHLGGNLTPLTMGGEPWRLLTAVLLHGGIIHHGFNLYALIYIMPFVSDIYGANKAMFAFVVTGLGSSLASCGWDMQTGQHAVSIGASGAVCGLIGLALVWGHRDGTSLGISIRNSMARWVMYILLFGFFVPRIDNAAHIGGWVIGGALALAIPTNLTMAETKIWKLLGAIAWVMLIAALAFIAYQAFMVPFPKLPIN